MKKLVELATIKGSPAEISQAADTVFAAVSGIRRSGQATIDSIATSLVISIMPKQLRLEWENKTEEDPLVPHIDQWIAFMRKKATSADQSQKPGVHAPAVKKPDKANVRSTGKVYYNQGESTSGGDQAPPSSKQAPPSSKYKNAKTTPKRCGLCTGAHFLFQCEQFNDMTVQLRKAHVESAALCLLCLRGGHKSQECTRPFRCRVCKQQHNTLLHPEGVAAPVSVNHVLQITDAKSDSTVSQTEHKMLMTSMVVVTGPSGQQLTVRGGAESSVISKKIMDTLNLQPIDWVNLSAIESSRHTPVRPKVKIIVSAVRGDWSKTVTPVVLPKVTINLPRHNLKALQELPHLKNLPLADPMFYQPRKVDLILDTDIFDGVLLPRKLTGPAGSPSAWDTTLGWG